MADYLEEEEISNETDVKVASTAPEMSIWDASKVGDVTTIAKWLLVEYISVNLADESG